MNDSNVTEVDFGLDRRNTARLFASLFNYVEATEAAILANPVPYMEQASRQIAELRMGLNEARDALRPAPCYYVEEKDLQLYRPPETMKVTRDEYERLVKCARIIEALT